MRLYENLEHFRASLSVSMETWGVSVRLYDNLERLYENLGIFEASLGCL